MEQLELVKENVLPLRRGRTLAAAAPAPDGGPAEKARQLESERSAFQAELAAYEGDDPLAVWLRYLAWTQTHYPVGGPESQLTATLYKCGHELLPLERYKNDVRYLRVWVQYADCLEEPKQVFDFLEHHKIGQEYALFYEARAAFLELRRNFDLALGVYEAGITRSAQPLQRLKTKFESFQSRMALRVARQRQDEADGIVPEEAVGARETLASRPAPAAAQRFGGLTSANVVDTRQPQKRGLPKDDEFSIFEDEAAKGPALPGAAGPKASWNSLGSQADTRKENMQTPAMWNSVRVPQNRAAVAPQSGFVLEVYEDEDLSPPPAPRPADAAQMPLRMKIEQEGSNLLMHSLLNHVAAAPVVAACAAIEPALMAPLQAHEMSRLYEALQAAQTNGEVSFEEKRAMHWLSDARNAAPPAPVEAAAQPLVEEVVAAAPPASPAAPVSQPPPVATPEPAAPEAVTAAVVEAPAAEVPQAQAEPVALPASLDAPCFPIVSAAAGADVTINTRDAYADIMNMFSDSLAVQGGSRKRACNASTSGRAGAGSAFAEPLFEVYEGEASPAASPGPGEAVDADLPAADADADAFAVFEDEPDEAGCGEYASDGENEDPLRQHYPAPPATDGPDDSLVFRPWSADELLGSGGENGEPLDAEMQAAAEAALCAGAGPAELLAQDSFEIYQDTAAFSAGAGRAELVAQDSFEVYQDTAAFPDGVARALAGDATGAVPQLSFAAAPASMFDGGFEVYEDTAAVPPVAFSAENTADFINPFSPAAVAQMLASLDEPVSVMQGVTVEDESAAAKLESSLSGARRHPHSGVVLQLGGFKYVLGKLCGRGAYADIYEAVDEDDADDFADAGSSAPVLALKVVRPPDAAAVSWEFVVMRRVAERVPHAERQLFLQARRLHMAGPLSVLVAAFGPHGTLQDGVNAMLAADRGGMHESLAMYFTVELLRALEVLHAAAFIHGDVKPDNVLLRFGGSQWEEWAPSRPGQWRERGVSLIDFGRSIDLTAHAPNAAFMGDCGTDNFRCVEMIAGKPWTFQADTFGALGCVHAMLFGTYMEVDLDERSGRWRRREPLKRYWCIELWEPLFDELLNVPSCQQQPELRRFRAAFEEHLAAPARVAEVRSKLMELTIMMAEQAAKAAKAA